MTSVRITQTRSVIGETRKHRGTLRSLGLGRIGKTAEHALGPELEGKLRHVAHLVTVEELGGKAKD
ncbi:MAG TPA: 50S ribosomal protein L30 [Gaiella sp.]|nr:50S ribosomal protein L30 [Gaiella sp.]